MIKQFNFYDIYGYLLPGILLLGLFWVPIGIFTQTWPDQDLSKALFLAALAYILGHILQSIANSVVPSTVPDEKNQQRFPSDLFLDKTNSSLSNDFKTRLAKQVYETFGLDPEVSLDGDGRNETSRNRQTAFFQARSFLLAKKSANYVEQFEGLYAMMRGLACSFLAGAVYLVGWGLSFYRDQRCIVVALEILLVIGIGGALISSGVTLSPKANAKRAVLWLAMCLLLTILCSGFWVSVAQSSEFWRHASANNEYAICVVACLALIAAARCFSSYRSFAQMFAVTVWRDFSAYLAFQPATPPAGEDSDQS